MTLSNDLIKNVRQDLIDGEICSADKDAFYLLVHASGLSLNDVIFDPKKLIKNIDYDLLKESISRRKTNEPISKIIGSKAFWQSSFYVNSHVLDPRPETEFLVEEVLNRSDKNNNKILDLGTGSGCIAIALALELPNCDITGSDVSKDALEVAEYNNWLNSANVQFVESDWFEMIDGTFDIIISNPPYLSEEDYSNLSHDIKFFEPKVALVGASDGLECYRQIVDQLDAYLSDQGVGFFEVGFGQLESVTNIFSQSGFEVFDKRTDYLGIHRVLCVKKAS